MTDRAERRIILASTFEQASIAARGLGLDRAKWRLARQPRDLVGVSPDTKIVVALPPLGQGDNDWLIRDLVTTRGFATEEVWT